MSTGVTALFAKPPVAGQAKTRLLPALGAEKTERVAQALLQQTWQTVRAAGTSAVVASTQPSAAALGLPDATVWLQGEGDLGERMERVLRRCCEQSGQGVIVGADCPALSTATLQRAHAVLREVDAVLVPAEDGGFGLIGLSRVPEGLLHGLQWSTDHALRDTVQRLTERGLTVRLLGRTFDIDTPGDLARLRRHLHENPSDCAVLRGALDPEDLAPVRLSVVVPVLNEAARIDRFLGELTALEGIDEVLVVDGGSEDDTVARAQTHPVRVLQAPRGRGPQLNAGAAAARGEVLLFVHADCTLPDDAAAQIEAALSAPGAVAGAFKLWTVPDDGPRWSAWWMHLADLRSRYTRYPYGDQALFCRRDAFERVGGFPDQPLLEDYELSRALHRLAPLARVDRRVRASGRRFAQRPLYYCALMNSFPLLYRAGVPAGLLATFYRDVR